MFGDQPPGATVQPCPQKKAQRPTYWIEIELLGEDGKPIPWEKYEVKLPDGSIAPGYLDSDGWARFDGLTAQGTCEVSFPNLDKDAWSKLETLPAKGNT